METLETIQLRTRSLVDACRARATQPFRSFHNNERGNVTIMMMALIMLFLGMTSSLTNTGTVVSEKIQLQTAADSAAYGSALHLSRELNLITATNMVIVLNGSAQAVMAADMLAFIRGIAAYVQHIVRIADHFSRAASLISGIFTAPAGIALAAWTAVYAVEVAIEMVRFFIWAFGEIDIIGQIIEFGQMFAGSGGLAGRINELYEFQQSVINGTPGAIDAQREFFEEFYECDILLSQPGQGELPGDFNHPVERGNGLTYAVALANGYYGSPLGPIAPGAVKQEDYEEIKADWDDFKNLNDGPRNAFAPSGPNRPVFDNATILFGYAMSTAAMFIHRRYHELKVQSPDEAEKDNQRSLIATAYRDGGSSNNWWLSGPANDIPAFGTGVFFDGVNPGDRMIAYAEGESFQAVAETIDGIPGLGPIINLYPWQLWSTLGMNWQPRLAHQTGLARALRSDDAMEDVWNAAGIDEQDLNVGGNVDNDGKLGTH